MHASFFRFILIPLFLLTLATCEPVSPPEPPTPATDTHADEAVIREACARFSQACMRGDDETMLALYTRTPNPGV